ncbi:hypothetical protein TruAng_002891 [Truncatella angustata]|nr:hypothetical protein TruAng_002891 [Truncatella angustata]
MAELCFGRPLGMLEKNEFNPWVKAIFGAIKMLPIANFIQYYPVLDALFTRFQPQWITDQRLFFAKQTEDRVNQRLQEGSQKPDIWNLVLAAQDTDNALSLEEMHSNADLFMMAGSETTDKMQLLCQEVRTVFDNAEEINLDRLASLKYLNACLKEALRVYPPVAIGTARIVPNSGATVLGRWLPAGTRVSCHQYSMYHSPWNFKNPSQFAPERWLGDPEYADDVQDAHQPFAYGPRNCLGQNVAMHEMRLVLASLVWNYDLELCDGNEDWTDQQTFALWIKKPLTCLVRSVAR